MLETTTHSGTVVQTITRLDNHRRACTNVRINNGTAVVYGRDDVYRLLEAAGTPRDERPSSMHELESFIHRATVRLVNYYTPEGRPAVQLDGYVPIHPSGILPRDRANYAPVDYRVTPENHALWAEGSVTV